MNPRVYFHIQISSIEASIPTGLRAAGVLQWNSPRHNSSTHGPLIAPCTTPESRLKEGRAGGATWEISIFPCRTLLFTFIRFPWTGNFEAAEALAAPKLFCEKVTGGFKRFKEPGKA